MKILSPKFVGIALAILFFVGYATATATPTLLPSPTSGQPNALLLSPTQAARASVFKLIQTIPDVGSILYVPASDRFIATTVTPPQIIPWGYPWIMILTTPARIPAPWES